MRTDFRPPLPIVCKEDGGTLGRRDQSIRQAGHLPNLLVEETARSSAALRRFLNQMRQRRRCIETVGHGEL